jgi:hypothetical protein
VAGHQDTFQGGVHRPNNQSINQTIEFGDYADFSVTFGFNDSQYDNSDNFASPDSFKPWPVWLKLGIHLQGAPAHEP